MIDELDGTKVLLNLLGLDVAKGGVLLCLSNHTLYTCQMRKGAVRVRYGAAVEVTSGDLDRVEFEGGEGPGDELAGDEGALDEGLGSHFVFFDFWGS